MSSDIEWTDDTWNCMVGCSHVAKANKRSGCDHCYAEGQVHRFGGPKKDEDGSVVRPSKYDRLATIRLGASKRPDLTFVPRDNQGNSLGKGASWTGAVWLLPDVLDVPLRRTVPTKYFVNSLSDVFHESVVGCEAGRKFIAAIMGVQAMCPQHTFQILTKRSGEGRRWWKWSAETTERYWFKNEREMWVNAANDLLRSIDPETDEGARAWKSADILMERWHWASQGEHGFEAVDEADTRRITRLLAKMAKDFPSGIDDGERDDSTRHLDNVWLGTSVEDQEAADLRIQNLLELPAGIRFLSVEPMLGAVVLPPEALGGYPESDEWARSGPKHPRIDWVICGGESGPKARPMHPAWARSLRDQCVVAGVRFFFKQVGEWMVHAEADDVTKLPWFSESDVNRVYQTDAPTPVQMHKVGKANAGRLLDGRLWDEYPS